MAKLELLKEESEVLQQVLEQDLTELEVEISRTDSIDYKSMLKHERDNLESILRKLTNSPAVARSF